MARIHRRPRVETPAPPPPVIAEPLKPVLGDYQTPDIGLMYDGTTIKAFSARATVTAPWVGLGLGTPPTDASGELPRRYIGLRVWLAAFSGSKAFQAVLLDADGGVLAQATATAVGPGAERALEIPLTFEGVGARTLLVGGVDPGDTAVILTSNAVTNKWPWVNNQPLTMAYTADASYALTPATTYPVAMLIGGALAGNVRGLLDVRSLRAGGAPEGAILKIENGRPRFVLEPDEREVANWREDFWSGDTGARFTQSLTSSGTIGNLGQFGERVGVVACNIVATGGSRAFLSTPYVPGIAGANTVAEFTAELRATVNGDGVSMVMGWGDVASATPNNGIQIQQTATGTWLLYGATAGKKTTIDTKVPVVAGQWVTARLEISASEANLYLAPSDPNKTMQHVATLPASAFAVTGTFMFGAQRSSTAGAANAALQVDSVHHRVFIGKRRGAQ